MTPQEFDRSLVAGDISPVYFFCGDNHLLMDRALRKITSLLVPDPKNMLDLHQYTAISHSPAEIIRAMRTVPFFSGKKLVIVRDAQAFKSSQWKTLFAACASPPSQCCLVFILHLDLREKKERARIRDFAAHGSVVVFENPRGEKNVESFVTRELSGYGKKIEPEALSVLVTMLDENAQRIAREVEKLVMFCASKDTISRDDVAEVVSCAARGTLFMLIDALVQQKEDTARSLLKSVLDSGTHPLAVLKLLARRFRQICLIQEMICRGARRGEIYNAMRPLPDQAIDALCRDAQSWTVGEMGRVFDLLFEVSILLKSSGCDRSIILEYLLERLCTLRFQAFPESAAWAF